MFNLKELLHKYKDIENPEDIKKKVLKELNMLLNGDFIRLNEIDIKKHTIFLKSHPAIKQKLFLNKKDAIERINSVLTGDVVVDIR